MKIHIQGEKMPISGEAIRMMNYAEDIATTLRRILILAPSLTADERRRVLDHMQSLTPSYDQVVTTLGSK
jgi:hypothetical protein